MRKFFRLLLLVFAVFVAVLGLNYVAVRLDAAKDLQAAEERIAEVIATGRNTLDLSGLEHLSNLPSGLSGMDGLVRLNLTGTRVSDIAPLATLGSLESLNIRETRVTDLSPLTGLQNLKTLDIGKSWVADLSPLVKLGALERLDIGDTQLQSLEPATRIPALGWINLHGAYALDGSQTHYEKLHQEVLEVYNGRAFRQNYRPDDAYLRTVRLRRLRARLGLEWLGSTEED